MFKTSFFQQLAKERNYSIDLQNCVSSTVQKLIELDTDAGKPGVLLGKIQSGKTRAFIGAIALAFDEGYDFTIVLTKGTKMLAKQTLNRIQNDFQPFIENDEIQVYDIMHLPGNLTNYELKQKIIIVAKKETNNLKRIIEAVESIYPELQKRRLLIIDDEADYASISFRKEGENIEAGKISTQIDELRRKVAASDYLQVTATPYSLYLQPSEAVEESKLYKPIRPSFTELLPIYNDYVGGGYYFSESQDKDSTAHYLFEEVPLDERNTLKRPDRRSFKIEEGVLTSKNIRVLREAMMNFIVGGAIRRIQQSESGEKALKYSFVIHTESVKSSHDWQEEIVCALYENFVRIAEEGNEYYYELVNNAYNNLMRSVHLVDKKPPSFEEIYNQVTNELVKGHILITKVNSEKDIAELSDQKGQLQLRAPFNIFIGGQILDRGITISNLIGFYYGRNPKTFQQDTVLQHSRMYGNRSKEDLSVTRFYTTHHIYEVLQEINDCDNALRNAIKKGKHDNGVYFIQKDPNNRVKPCSPNKILLSNITTLIPYKRIHPVGFQTGFKSNIGTVVQEIEDIVSEQIGEKKLGSIDLQKAFIILDKISETLLFEDGIQFDWGAAKACIQFLITGNKGNTDGEILLMVKTGRKLSRKNSNGLFQDTPWWSDEMKQVKEIAINKPALLLFKEEGSKENGWRGTPFWWPVIVAPKNTTTAVFANETTD